MNDVTNSSSLKLEFFRKNAQPVQLKDLGTEFIEIHKIPVEKLESNFRIAIEPKVSKAGNVYFEYSQNNVPLPDGLETILRVENTIITFGSIKASKAGHDTRQGEANFLFQNMIYESIAYMTQSKTPFWIKVVAHKAPDRSENIKKANAAPKGGSIDF